jgi:hypothetical protein
MTYDFYVRAVETVIDIIERLDDNLDAIDTARGAIR